MRKLMIVGILAVLGCGVKKPVASGPLESFPPPPPIGKVKIVPTLVASGPTHVEWKYEVIGDRCWSGSGAGSGVMKVYDSHPCRAGIDESSIRVYRVILDGKQNDDGTMDISVHEIIREPYKPSDEGVATGTRGESSNTYEHVKRVDVSSLFKPILKKETLAALPASIALAEIHFPGISMAKVTLTKATQPDVVRWINVKDAAEDRLPADIERLIANGYSKQGYEVATTPEPIKLRVMADF